MRAGLAKRQYIPKGSSKIGRNNRKENNYKFSSGRNLFKYRVVCLQLQLA